MHFGADGMSLARLICWTWAVMVLLVCGSWLVTRNLSTTTRLSRWQNLLEVVVSAMRDQIREVGQQDPAPYLAFVGTLFMFIATPRWFRRD
jgi:F-type H+-transporting ATPase subunit a